MLSSVISLVTIETYLCRSYAMLAILVILTHTVHVFHVYAVQSRACVELIELE